MYQPKTWPAAFLTFAALVEDAETKAYLSSPPLARGSKPTLPIAFAPAAIEATSTSPMLFVPEGSGRFRRAAADATLRLWLMFAVPLVQAVARSRMCVTAAIEPTA